MTRQVKWLAVHCSATKAGVDITEADIDRMHKSNGWSGTGYHFVIRLDGDIQLGRPLDEDHMLEPNEVGAHVAGYNSESVGICLIGGLDKNGKAANTFTANQWRSLDLVLRGLRGRWPNAAIRGHRDFPKVAKDCPCFDVRTWCKSVGIDPK